VRWRRLIIAVHRDVGYLVAGLTVMYAVSGVAVNHVADWNPNYIIETVEHQVGDIAEGSTSGMTSSVLERLGIRDEPTSAIRMGPGELRIFFEGRTLKVTLPGGRVLDETVRRRPVLFELNFLHLNHGKGSWTAVADVYALALLTLALTGIFIIPGRKGLGGRGRWLLLAGVLLPVVYLLVAT